MNLVKTILQWLTAPAYEKFLASLKNPQAAQDRIFKSMLGELSSSSYGQNLKITKHADYAEFKSLVPIVTYDDIAHLIEPSVKDKKSALLASPIMTYEITSGSSGKNKTIPYTRSALLAFQKMAAIWVHDTLKATPILRELRVFYAISPPRTNNPLGFNDDEEYLGAIGQLISAKFSVVPKHLHKVSDFQQFRFLLSLHLLASQSLEIIYIWSPSYWLSLLEFIEAHKEALNATLEQGYYDLDRRYYLKPHLSVNLALAQKTVDWARIWPSLQVISCWTDGQALGFCEHLQALFPKTKIQAKGLLATEAVMTIKVDSLPAPAPFIDEVYFEFINDMGQVCRLHELCLGQNYEVIISNLSGLYRYRTHDVIKVVDFYEETPLLRFMGRSNRTSDMVGEKVTEFLANEMVKHFSLNGCNILIPDHEQREYVLLTSDALYGSKLSSKEIDGHLSKNCHYLYARELGQLKPPKVRFEPELSSLYEQYYLNLGMKWGDIKVASLVTKAHDAKDLLALALKNGTVS